MTEGAIADWSGIYLRHDTGASAPRRRWPSPGSRSGWRSRDSEATSSTSASEPGGCCEAGWRWWRSHSVACCWSARLFPLVIGFVLCGLGIANATPLLFSAAGRLEPPSSSLAAAFTLGYTGFIVGPPVIGVLADQIGLPETLSLLLVAALAVTVLGGRATARTSADRLSDMDRPREAEPVIF